MLRRIALTLALAACALTHATQASAQEMDLPVPLQMSLFMKVLTFDRHLEVREQLTIALVYQSGNRASAAARDEAAKALTDPRVTGTMNVTVVDIDLDKDRLAEKLKTSGASVLYLAPLRGYDVASVAAAARESQVTTMTGVPDYLAEGIAVSMRRQADRPRLLINLAAAKLEGADFSAELLKLAQVTR
jgi:hypothetical protein